MKAEAGAAHAYAVVAQGVASRPCGARKKLRHVRSAGMLAAAAAAAAAAASRRFHNATFVVCSRLMGQFTDWLLVCC
jgi:hypothetical protein